MARETIEVEGRPELPGGISPHRLFRKLLYSIGAAALVYLVGMYTLEWLVSMSTLRGTSPAKGDVRRHDSAVRDYYKAHGSLPPMQPFREITSDTEFLIESGGVGLGALAGVLRNGRPGITTPVSYLFGVYPDRFSKGQRLPLAYYENGTSWVIYSIGTNQQYDIRDPARVLALPEPQRQEALTNYTWDPTNGAVSGGDICLWGP